MTGGAFSRLRETLDFRRHLREAKSFTESEVIPRERSSSAHSPAIAKRPTSSSLCMEKLMAKLYQQCKILNIDDEDSESDQMSAYGGTCAVGG